MKKFFKVTTQYSVKYSDNYYFTYCVTDLFNSLPVAKYHARLCLAYGSGKSVISEILPNMKKTEVCKIA